MEYRIVIDEGHQLGRSSTTNTIQMATLLEAERRWILTGTPTKSYSHQVANAALRHLFQVLLLFHFLQSIFQSFDENFITYFRC